MTSTVQIQIFTDSGFQNEIPSGAGVAPGSQLYLVFTVVPAVGAGVPYDVFVVRDGTATLNGTYYTDDTSRWAIEIADAFGGSADPGDEECVEARVAGGWENPWGVACWNAPALSDVNLKEHITEVDREAVLDQLANTPICYWNYTSENQSLRHIGPMAQDFAAQFAVGDCDTKINLIDGQGVTMASIQALYEMVKEKDSRIGALERELEEIKAKLA